MYVTQDYKLLTTWSDLLTARVKFFEPLGTHTSLVRELKAELKITNEALAPVQVSSDDYTKLVLAGAERKEVESALAIHISNIHAGLKLTPVNALETQRTWNDRLAAAQSAYAKVRA